MSSIFVVDPTEIYACGLGGLVLEGSEHGWSILTTAEMPMSVVKCGDTVWIADQMMGLKKLAGNRLEEVNDRLKAMRLYAARDNLLLSCGNRIVETPNGQSLRVVSAEAVADSLRSIPLSFAPEERVDDDPSFFAPPESIE